MSDPLVAQRPSGLLLPGPVTPDADLETWTAEINDEISRAVTAAEALPPPGIETLFTDVYAKMPPHLEEQMKHALARGLGTKFEGAFPL